MRSAKCNSMEMSYLVLVNDNRTESDSRTLLGHCVTPNS
jgi:hypothetical protein